MQRYGVIDLGSNTIRLVVYDVKEHAKPPYSGKFDAIVNEKKAAGLSAYVEDGALSPAGVEKAIDVLNDHLESARGVGCKKCKIFATAVIRNATNSHEVVHEIEKACGAKPHVLSGEDEAHLGFVGATCDRKIESGVLIDIGGGSTELTQVQKDHDAVNVSLDQGSVSSYANHVELVFPTPEEEKAIEQDFQKRMSSNHITAENSENLFGIGGSVRAVAKMHGRMQGSDKSTKVLKPSDVESVIQLLRDDPSTFAHLAVKAAPDRLHTLVPGAIIVRTLMETYQSETLTICKYGVREGYLIEHFLN